MTRDQSVAFGGQTTALGSRRAFVALALACLAVPSCSGGGATPFRFSGIPDADIEALARRYADVAAYLSATIGRPTRYVHVPDYTAAVTALASGKIDAAWLGGVTAVQADERTPGGVRFVAARPKDLEFRSYFIANRAWLMANGLAERTDRAPQAAAELAGLRQALASARFSFGAKSSTSGHVMPRWFLEAKEVAIDPEKGFRGPPVYQLKGGHAATLRAVADGAVDVGVVNFAAWEEADDATKTAAPVVFVTPTYVDYCFVARNDLDPGLQKAVEAALLGLSPADPVQADVLSAFSTDAFVAVRREQWDQIRAVLSNMDEPV